MQGELSKLKNFLCIYQGISLCTKLEEGIGILVPWEIKSKTFQ